MADLNVKLGPLSLKNPVMTASGTFGYGEEYDDLMQGVIDVDNEKQPQQYHQYHL